jgi:hypothetical protein
MKRTLKLLALAGMIVFGLFSIAQIAVLASIYIEDYRMLPPPFPIPSYHRFPIYRLNRDLRDLAPIVFAFIACLIGYFRLDQLERENSK